MPGNVNTLKGRRPATEAAPAKGADARPAASRRRGSLTAIGLLHRPVTDTHVHVQGPRSGTKELKVTQSGITVPPGGGPADTRGDDVE